MFKIGPYRNFNFFFQHNLVWTCGESDWFTDSNPFGSVSLPTPPHIFPWTFLLALPHFLKISKLSCIFQKTLHPTSFLQRILKFVEEKIFQWISKSIEGFFKSSTNFEICWNFKKNFNKFWNSLNDFFLQRILKFIEIFFFILLGYFLNVVVHGEM